MFLMYWHKFFDPSQMLILDGLDEILRNRTRFKPGSKVTKSFVISSIIRQELISNPSNVISRIEDFVGVEPFLTEERFIYDEEKGFYCLQIEANFTECLRTAILQSNFKRDIIMKSR